MTGRYSERDVVALLAERQNSGNALAFLFRTISDAEASGERLPDWLQGAYLDAIAIEAGQQPSGAVPSRYWPWPHREE